MGKLKTRFEGWTVCSLKTVMAGMMDQAKYAREERKTRPDGSLADPVTIIVIVKGGHSGKKERPIKRHRLSQRHE